MGDGAQLLYRHRPIAADFFCVGRGKVSTKTFQIENVADERNAGATIDKMAVQHTQESTQLHALSGLLGDFPIKCFLYRFTGFDAARRKSIDRRFVSVFGVQQDLAVELADCEHDLASSIGILLPPICAHVCVRLNEMAAAERLPVFARKGVQFRLVDLGRFTGMYGHRGIVRVEERNFPISNSASFYTGNIGLGSPNSAVIKFIGD